MGCPNGVVANVLACIIVLSEFELELCSLILISTNTFGKVLNWFGLCVYTFVHWG